MTNPTPEPRGHRGHPSDREARRASRVAIRLERAVKYLERDGFSRTEAIAFIAGIAHQKGVDLGETWTIEDNARRTIERVLDGRSAKEWSMDAVVLALFEVADLLDLRSPE